MRKLAFIYLIACSLLYAGFQCFAQVSSTHAGLGKPAAGGPNLTALDGSAQGTNPASMATSVVVTLTTANTNDIIVLSIEANNFSGAGNALTVTSIVDTAGLTWTSRAISYNDVAFPIFEYYAISASALTADIITITFNNTTNFGIEATAFGISGANTTTKFDSNGSLPVAPLTGPFDPLTYSTSNANDFIISHFRMASTANPTQGAGWTKIIGANFQLVQYRTVSATQASQPAAIGTGVGDSNGGIVDAFISN